MLHATHRCFDDFLQTTERPSKRARLEDSDIAPTASSSHSEAAAPSDLSHAKVPGIPNPKSHEADPTLTEFLEVMKPRNKKDPTWANNDDPTAANAATTGSKLTEQPKKAGFKVTHDGVDDKNATGVEESAMDESLSDLEWMRRRMASTVLAQGDLSGAMSNNDIHRTDSSVRAQASTSTSVVDEKTAGPSSTSDAQDNEAETLLKESPRLFLRNLSYSCSISDLEEAFGKFGEVVQVC